MKWAVWVLLVVNLVLFVWGNFLRSAPGERALVHAGVGTIRIIQEQSKLSWSGEAKVKPGSSPVRGPVTGRSQDPPPVQSLPRKPRAKAVRAVPRKSVPAPAKPTATKVAETPAAPSPAEPPVRCWRLDGLTDKKPAERLAERMRGLGLSVSVQERSVTRTKGYWVLIPPAPSYQAAQALARKARAAGVKETWIVRRGDTRNAVSLGVFSNGDRARQWAAKFRRAGLKIDVTPRTAKETAYSVSLRAARTLAIAATQLPKDAKAVPCR